MPLLAQNVQVGHKSLVADLPILAITPDERLADAALLGEGRQARELFFDQRLEKGLGMQRHATTMPKNIAITNSKIFLAVISVYEKLYRKRMHAAFINLLREFIEEMRIRRRRTNCPHERSAAAILEQQLLDLLEQAESKPTSRVRSRITSNGRS